MAAPSNYFYDGQVRRYISQFIRMVSDFYVSFGADRNGNIAYQRVPVNYGDQSRQAATILRNNSENTLNSVPAMAVYVSGLAYDQTRLQDPSYTQSMQIRQRQFDPVSGTYTSNQGQAYTVERMMPAPYKLTLKLDVWTSNTEQKLQLIEQLSQLFNPAMELQSTDNYVDWASLTYVLLTDVTWDSRSVPTGAEEPISIATLTFEMPIWISTSIKVKKMGVIQQVITNLEDLQTMGSLGQTMVNVMNYGVLMTTDNSGGHILRLLRPKDVVSANSYGIDSVATNNDWNQLLNHYGNIIAGSSEIRIVQPNGGEIIGTFAVNPVDTSTVIYSPYANTLPSNTMTAINAIIDPQSVNVGSYLTSPASGTRYLLINDLGDPDNGSNGAQAWQGTSGQNLIANVNDIVEYNGQFWRVVFDSRTVDELQYVTNLTTHIQYKWQNQQWTKAYDGVYPEGEWMIVL
jgi:T4-like virus Myoviridae tail sheath stabiliser